jgi:hypothetical protein
MNAVYYSNAVSTNHAAGADTRPTNRKLGPLSSKYFVYIVSTAVDKKPWQEDGGQRMCLH